MDDMYARGICDAVERIAKSVESLVSICEEWKDKNAPEYAPPVSKPAPTRPNADGLVSGVPMPDDDIPF